MTAPTSPSEIRGTGRRSGKKGGPRHVRLKAGILVAGATLALLLFFPRPLPRQLRGVCFIECWSRYAIPLPEGDTLRLTLPDSLVEGNGRGTDADSVARRIPEAADSLSDFRSATGFFVSPQGHIATSASLIGFRPARLAGKALRERVERQRARLAELRDMLERQDRELDYYHDRHAVTDEGYATVEARRSAVKARLLAADSLLRACGKVLEAPHAVAVLECDLTVKFCEKTGPDRLTTRLCQARLVATTGRLALLQTAEKRLPKNASRFSPYLLPLRFWMPPFVSRRVIGFPAASDRSAWPEGLFPDVLPADSAMRPLWPDGAVVTDVFGHLDGIVVQGRTLPGDSIDRLLRVEGAYPRRLLDNLREAARSFFVMAPSFAERTWTLPDSTGQNVESTWLLAGTYGHGETPAGTYVGRMKDSLPDGPGRMAYADGSTYSGLWRGGARQGAGTLRAADGTLYQGTWLADSLPEGRATDSLGTYAGHFDRRLLRARYGTWETPTGSWYAGEWLDGKRNGFGAAAGEEAIVQCGIWRRGKFLGEEMDFTRHRIYGIDISRYQHEAGGRRHPIEWSRLRITHLGTNARKVAPGEKDFPVSFVYVKSTQGTSIRSTYYAADAAAARKRGIPVGAYHFFSPTSGREQARFFLKAAPPRRGDLPPMLDVELTDRQIAAMGGAESMFREMKEWMRLVEHAYGLRPLLYVSQDFVNRYLATADPEWQEYDVWVARYGEYKPYVRLLYWQLSPKGRVAGIRGMVDINVFDGTPEQFRDYLDAHRVGLSAR